MGKPAHCRDCVLGGNGAHHNKTCLEQQAKFDAMELKRQAAAPVPADGLPAAPAAPGASAAAAPAALAVSRPGGDGRTITMIPPPPSTSNKRLLDANAESPRGRRAKPTPETIVVTPRRRGRDDEDSCQQVEGRLRGEVPPMPSGNTSSSSSSCSS